MEVSLEEDFVSKLNKIEIPIDIIDKGTIKEYKFYNDILNLFTEKKNK